MSINIHILAASKKMRPYAKRLKFLTVGAVKSVKRLLSLTNIDIVFSDYPEGAIPEIGIGGFTPNAHTLFISLNLQYPKLKKMIGKELLPLLVHELHHAIRWRKPGYGSTLWEQMITEGLADHFSMEVTGAKIPPRWSRALTVQQKKILWRHAKLLLHHSPLNSVDHRAWFFGSKEKKIPRWTGYTLGYDIVAAYLKTHPKAKASTLVDVPADLFLGKIKNCT
ncbi:MAG: DUF2268 domain-containing putative Zn-dependent protease [Candidatus Uhrbacteria bacterium]|nr:DUF2268 domain-containing putative Zn-dependent protease [Candidatus Uhrbacteria bacterium]MDP3794264.1 DUF2268 domain-containing putative Zn-dependent protease [Candidatus Uhrbacteria bacterium]